MFLPPFLDTSLSRRPLRLALALASGLAYLAAFGELRSSLGLDASILSVVPVMITAGLLGFWPGVLAGALIIPLNSYLLAAPGEAIVDMLLRYRIGHVAGLITGVVVGWLSDLLQRYRVQSEELAREIAERRQAETALREFQATLEERVAQRTLALQESEARYRQIYESDRVIQLLVDPQTLQIVDGNAAAAAYYGYSREALRTMSIAQITCLPVDEFRPRMAAAVAQAHTTHRFCHQLANGEHRQVEVNASPITAQGRRLMHLLVIDITEQQQAEQALQAANQRLERILESIHDGFFILDHDWRYTYVNDSAAASGFTTKEALLGNCIWDLTPGSVGGPFYQACVRARDEGQASTETDVYYDYGALGGKWYNLTIYPFEGGVAVHYRDITDRQQAEVTLRENEYFLTKSQEVGDLGSYYLNARTGNWISSKKLDEIFGIDDTFPKNVAGWLQLVHPAFRVEMEQHLNQHVLAEHNRFDKEYKIVRHSDGQERWMHGLGELEFDAAGQPIKMIGTIQDITRRKLAEQALAESERRFRETLELSSLYAVTLDTAGRITFSNGRLAEAAGQPAEALLGQDWFERFILPELDLRLFFEACIRQGAFPANYENEIVLPSGQRRLVNWTNTMLRNEAGQLTGVASLGLDVTESRRLEQALRESEVQLRLFYELPFIGMAITSPKTKRWVRVNERLAEILGYPREVLVQKTWAEMTHPEDLDVDVAEFERVLSGATNGYRMDKRFIRPDGVVVYATIDVRCVRAADGSVDFFVATVQDIGDRKRIEAELERRVAERTAQLEVANRELEAFAYSVSHDLRAPLRAIDGFSQAVLEDYGGRLEAPGQDYLRRVRQGALQMGHLIDALLLLSRVTRQELRRQPVDLSALARDVAQDLRAGAPSREVGLSVQPGLAATGDPHLLSILLTNLLGNAWKFTRRQPAAQVEFGRVLTQGERAYFVRDNGVGFDSTYTAKLFQPFQRLHGSAEFEGTGIGLATVQRVVQRHGGRVWAEGVAGVGATFYFTLPD